MTALADRKVYFLIYARANAMSLNDGTTCTVVCLPSRSQIGTTRHIYIYCIFSRLEFITFLLCLTNDKLVVKYVARILQFYLYVYNS